MNPRRYISDELHVTWIKQLLNGLSGHETSNGTEVRSILQEAQNERVKVELVEASTGSPVRMSTTIEQVREGDVIISRPMHNSQLRPLASSGRLTIHLSIAGRDLKATVTNEGRVRMASGGGKVFYGYRLSLPTEFQVEERRRAVRIETNADFAPDVEISALGTCGPVHGVVVDMSANGMKVRSRNALGKVESGQRVYVKVELPRPVGLFKQIVHVVDVSPCADTGSTVLRLAFFEPSADIAEMLKHYQREKQLEDRLAARQ